MKHADSTGTAADAGSSLTGADNADGAHNADNAGSASAGSADSGGNADGVLRRRLGTGFWLAVAWLMVMALMALFAPLLPLPDPTQVAFGGPREAPSADAWFGTDALGRDVFSRTMHGARISLAVGGFAIVFGMVIGGGLGILAGYFRGLLDQAVRFAFFVLLSFPALVLAILITATLERSLLVVSLTIGILAVAPVGLLARACTLVFAEREFVAAARVVGARHGRIILRELLPNVVIPMGALTLLGMALAVVAEGSLAFLGLSVAGEDSISWGKMIVDGAGLRDLQNAAHVTMFPVSVMFVTVLALNFAGDRIRQRFDVKELAF
ncbi:MAG: ABC transporter permease [Acidimicrobiaceae bacterium]|nr:ABC transporter permease [Acidimicrobiaceae bacterium]